jgi:predicted Zn-dependent protease with MMP-like domain
MKRPAEDDDLDCPELDAWLDRIDERYAEDDLAGVREVIARALRACPDSVDLRLEEAYLLREEERFGEALEAAGRVLSADPEHRLALSIQSNVLTYLGRFREARELLEETLRRARKDDESSERAAFAQLFWDLGICLDREGLAEEADRRFRKAARLDPETFSPPPRLSAEAFEELVGEAMDSIPDAFHEYIEQVSVVVLDYPADPDLDPFLLGLYEGVPRTERSWDGIEPPERVFVFKRNHEILHPRIEELREEVRKTVIHEIAHHFGLDEDAMGEYA